MKISKHKYVSIEMFHIISIVMAKIDLNVAIVGTGRDIEKFIPQTMINIQAIQDLFTDSLVIIYENDSKDKTLEKLRNYDIEVISENGVSGLRTHRIAHGRNRLLERVKQGSFDLMIMLDLDNVMNEPINLFAIIDAIQHWDQWDVISFNRKSYYDTWALRYEGRDVNFVGLGGETWHYNGKTIKLIENILKDRTEYFPVYSAFNSLAIYKTTIFGYCQYDGNNYYPQKYSQDCEHVNFHKCLSEYRHMISPKYIVDDKHQFETFFYNRFGFKHISKSLNVTHSELHKLPPIVRQKVFITDTDQTDASTSERIPKYREILDQVDWWFATNVIDHHPRIIPVPLGIDYHTRYRHKQISPRDQETTLLELRRQMKPFWERKNRIFADFHTGSSRNHPPRVEARRLLPSDLVTYSQGYMDRNHLWKIYTEYAFVASPAGNGLDCHRHWEILALGGIPVMKSSAIDPIFDDLPVLIVDSWEDLTEDLLHQTVAEFRNMTFNYEKLTLNYYRDLLIDKLI